MTSRRAIQQATERGGTLVRGAGPVHRGAARTGLAALAVIAVGLLLAGCLPVNAGSAAMDEFEERVNADYGEWVESFRLSSNNTLPFMGDAFGSVVLRPDTPPEVFAEVYDFVTGYSGPGDFDGSGVEANGVGVCAGDAQLAARQQLRDALHAAGTSLAGDWPCPPRAGDVPLPYAATLDELDADLQTVRSLGAGAGLQLVATITDPAGMVAGPLDAVPAALPDTLRAVAALTGVERFEADGTALRIAVTPTADLGAVQAAAERAAGADLEVEVLPGSLDASEQAQYAELGPVVDALRQLPGVDEVQAQTQSVEVRTADPQQAVAIHDAAVAMPELDALGFRLVVAGAPQSLSAEYFRPIGGADEHFGAFAALLASPGVTEVTVHEAGRQAVWVAVEVAGPLLDAVQLKALLPMGVPAQLGSDADGTHLRFTTAEHLAPGALSGLSDRVDLQAFAAAWNAQP